MILITIINRESHELTPIIYEYRDRVSKHILIYDDRDVESAKEMERWIEGFCGDIESIELDEDSKSDMVSIQKYILALDSSDIYLNATNSDTALLVILSGAVLGSGGKIVAYDKFENSYNIIDSGGFSNHHISDSMGVGDFVSSLGYEILSEVDIDEVVDRGGEILNLFSDFNIFFKVRRYLYQQRVSALASIYPDIISTLIELQMIDKNYRVLKNISYFGTLFEEFIYLKLREYNFDDIKVGVVVIFDTIEDEPKSLNVNNEFDILAIKDNHIYTIECKLGDNISPQDIIYKSDSLLGYFGDDSKNMIINIHPDNSHKVRKPIKPFGKQIKLRAITNSIEVYNAIAFGSRKFHKKLSSFFGVKKRLFLLGGYDLEMRAIREILDREGERYIDKNLSWGAKLSDYRDELKDDYLFIGIELIEDITPPQNYISIDHHNNLQSNPSSLEQIGNILGVELSRKERLIALNDSGYIPAMVEYGATQREIDEIRKKDRKAQGVTRDDELLAIESIKNRKKVKDIVVVKSLTDKFSPIVDRLYGESILIYNRTKLNYYGRDVESIVANFSKEIDEKRAYYGGGFGFFGLSEGSFGTNKIEEYRDEILDILKRKKK
jgi:hypothetical protein